MLQPHSLSTLLLLSLSLLLLPVHGFFPTTWKEVVFGNGGTSHVQITETAFEDRAKSYFPSLTKITRQMKKARDEIADANAKVDDVQDIASYHCDGESFGEAQTRIQELKKKAVDALKADQPQVSVARDNIGQALHTIQDFYAHSNWVELGKSTPNADLIRNRDMGSYSATFADQTCVACLDILPPPFWDGTTSLPCGGYDCAANTNGFSKLTSGYYFGEDHPLGGAPIPAYKCHHGGPTDDARGAVVGILIGTKPGINKDSLNCVWSPHADLHTPAASMATAATNQYFDDLREALDSDKLLRLLFGVPSLAFAIDTTGSMGGIIDTVRSQAIEVATSLIGTNDEPGLYVVSPFNDPSTGPVTVTSDFDTFQSAINSLSAAGGDDCPELSVTGMMNAIEVMDPGSTLLMFTDAASKDAAQWTAMAAEANKKKIDINIFKYDSGCDDGGSGSLRRRQDSQADRIYSEICAVTGGQYRTGPTSDVSKISTFLKNVITANPISILRVESSLAGGTDTFNVPVDSYTTRVSIALLATDFNLTVTQPDGTLLAPSSPGVIWNTFSSSISITIASPVPGSYIVSLSGTGSYILSSDGVSELQLTSFNFASVGGRPGHTGWYPLGGPPPYNQAIGATAQMSSEFKTATFSFRAPSFALLSTASMEPGSGDVGYPATNDFFAILNVPSQVFLVYVNGVDDRGLQYQRLLETPIAPILAEKPFALAGNQTFNLAGNHTTSHASSSSSSSSSSGGSSSRWSNETTPRTSTSTAHLYPTLPAGNHSIAPPDVPVYPTAPTDAYSTNLPSLFPVYSTAPSLPLYSTQTILSTRTHTLTSCPHCPAPSHLTSAETLALGTTLCPVTLTTRTAYATTTYTVSECPNLADTCGGKGSVTTRVLATASTVVAVPVVDASGPEAGTDHDVGEGEDSGVPLNEGPTAGVFSLEVEVPSPTGPGTGPDTGLDTGPDTGPGTDAGTGTGTGPDTGPDTGPGTGPGTGVGTGTGTGTGTGPGTGVGNGTGTSPGTGVSNGTGTSPDTGPDTGPGTGPDTGPGLGMSSPERPSSAPPPTTSDSDVDADADADGISSGAPRAVETPGFSSNPNATQIYVTASASTHVLGMQMLLAVGFVGLVVFM